MAIFKHTYNHLESVLISINRVGSINNHTPDKQQHIVQCSFWSVL